MVICVKAPLYKPTALHQHLTSALAGSPKTTAVITSDRGPQRISHQQACQPPASPILLHIEARDPVRDQGVRAGCDLLPQENARDAPPFPAARCTWSPLRALEVTLPAVPEPPTFPQSFYQSSTTRMGIIYQLRVHTAAHPHPPSAQHASPTTCLDLVTHF